MDDLSRAKPKETSLVGVNIPKLRIHDENIRRNGPGAKKIPHNRPRNALSSSSSTAAKAPPPASTPAPPPRRRQPLTSSSSSSSFLDAIQKGETVKLHIGGRGKKSENCNCDGCALPIEDFRNISDDGEDDDKLKGEQDSSDEETESEDDDDILFRKLPSRNFVVSSSKVVQANSRSSGSTNTNDTGSKKQEVKIRNISSESAVQPTSGSPPLSSFKKLSLSSREQKRTSVTFPARRFDLVDTDDEEADETSENEEDDDDSNYNDSTYDDDEEEEDNDSNASHDSFDQNIPPKKWTIGTKAIDNHTRSAEVIDLVDSDSGENDTSGSDLSFIVGDASFDSSSSSSIEIVATKPAPTTVRTIPKVRSNHLNLSKKIGQNNRDSMTQSAFREFNQEVFGGKLSSVEVVWSKKLNTTAGQTRLLKASSSEFLDVPPARLAKVELSTKVIDDQTKLRTTLLHELIHAAVWILEGVSRPPHGKEFKRWAKLAMRKIKDVEVTTTHSYEINYRYAWACTKSSCAFIVKRHSKSVDTKKHLCGRCKSRLIEVDPNSSTGTSATPKKQPKPSAYNVFVRNQYKTVRQDLIHEQISRGIKNPNVAQSDVMKECARRWRDLKGRQTK